MDSFVIRKRKAEKPTTLQTDADESSPKRICKHLKTIIKENLNIQYGILYQKTEASLLFRELKSKLVFLTGREAQVKVFNKWVDIPRQHAAYGDEGLEYTFSHNRMKAKPWTELPQLLKIKEDVEKVLNDKIKFNFVLVNFYEDGNKYMGEHRDDEKELVKEAPIASVSLGQERDFVFKHKDAKNCKVLSADRQQLKMVLQNGSLLVMNHPTNSYWLHSLPKRKMVAGARINLTFRVMKNKSSSRRTFCYVVKDD